MNPLLRTLPRTLSLSLLAAVLLAGSGCSHRRAIHPPFSPGSHPPSSSCDRPVFTTLVGDCPRYPPTFGRFG